MRRLREAIRLKRPELWAGTTRFNAFQADWGDTKNRRRCQWLQRTGTIWYVSRVAKNVGISVTCGEFYYLL